MTKLQKATLFSLFWLIPAIIIHLFVVIVNFILEIILLPYKTFREGQINYMKKR